jgi:ectoine hydroxylase-related dioxygenase (phytanoyl-CoA dioxygenase family)
MRREEKKHILNLEKKGITFIKNVFSKSECNKFIKRFEKLTTEFEKKKRKLGDQGQTIQNYFAYDEKLLKFLQIKKVDQILKQVIDEDYVLINSSLTNRFNRKENLNKKESHFNNLGGKWHHDSRIIGGKRLDKGFSYTMLIMFDNFTKENGCTEYVEKSHLIRNKFPQKNKDYKKSKKIIGEQGTVVIFDTGLWHRAGVPSSNKSRWSIFAYFGPWFMKPYYDFPTMFKKNKRLDKNMKKLLHFNSIPPKNEMQGTRTLKKL